MWVTHIAHLKHLGLNSNRIIYKLRKYFKLKKDACYRHICKHELSYFFHIWILRL